MEIQLIEGEFSPSDALELITQMIHVKIKFHENKINNDSIEEDIKAREAKIKKLNTDLFEIRNIINKELKTVKINAKLKFNEK